MSAMDELIRVASDVVERAQRGGATVAEATVQSGSHLSTKVRMQQPELVEEAGSRSLGLRVMVGQRVAVTYTSDTSEQGQQVLIEDAIELAKLSQPDAFAGPPEAGLLSREEEWSDVESYDSAVSNVDAATALDEALRGEQAALESDPRISNSEGATYSRANSLSVLVTDQGFVGTQRGSYASLVVNPVAGDSNGKKRSGYYWSAARHLSDLEDAVDVGAEAAKRTLAQLGADKIPTQEMPVIFDRDAARSILGLVASCVLGGSVWRKSSYLADRLGDQIASELVTLEDDPFIPRAPGSRPFDGEGLLCRNNIVVDRGVLKTFLTDSYSGRKLEMNSTRSASRSSSGGVSVSTSNFVLKPGTRSRDELIAATPRALYVNNMMGFGFNAVTGDFSRGASGFLVDKGELTQPVSEVTISLNLDQILKRIDAVADDLDHRTSIASPTFRVSSMTVAGR